MRKSWTVAAILVVSLAACTRPSKPPTIHDPSKIQDIEVIHWSKEGGRGPLEEYTIEDRKRIEAIVALLRSNNTGYRKDTELAHWNPVRGKDREEYTLHFQESPDNPSLLSVSFGPDWLSCIDDEEDDSGDTFFRTRPLSSSEREELVALIARHPEDRGRWGG
ncbi:MAG TPA: hypothetical protein VN493_14405 [Thermoanaerobaculia bacterium]|nr:hypothetical protein [Thermoanaerobaculia bacterium]